MYASAVTVFTQMTLTFESMTLKTISAAPTRVANVYAKFHWNPSTKYTNIAPHKIDVDGRTTDGLAHLKHIVSGPEYSMVVVKIKNIQKRGEGIAKHIDRRRQAGRLQVCRFGRKLNVEIGGTCPQCPHRQWCHWIVVHTHLSCDAQL